MFRNEMSPIEVLGPEALETVERGWMRLVEEIGVELLHEEARELLREAGQRVEGEVVHLDPDWVLAQVAQAPSEFHLRARDPAHAVTLGGRNMVFASVSGPPFFRVGAERGVGTLADYELMARLVHCFEELDLVTLPVVEPDGRSTGRQSVIYAAALIPVSLLPTLTGMATMSYLVGASALGAIVLWLAAEFAATRSMPTARRLFFATIIYLPLLWALLLADHYRNA